MVAAGCDIFRFLRISARCANPEGNGVNAAFRIRIGAYGAVDQCQVQALLLSAIAVFAVGNEDCGAAVHAKRHAIAQSGNVVVDASADSAACGHVITEGIGLIGQRRLPGQNRNDVFADFFPVYLQLYANQRLVFFQNIGHLCGRIFYGKVCGYTASEFSDHSPAQLYATIHRHVFDRSADVPCAGGLAFRFLIYKSGFFAFADQLLSGRLVHQGFDASCLCADGNDGLLIFQNNIVIAATYLLICL